MKRLTTNNSRTDLVLATCCVLLVACGGEDSDSKGPLTTQTVAEQVDRGGTLYGQFCAKCHGASGEGGSAPAVVGSGALPLDPPATAKVRSSQFRTALDVGSFALKYMPGDAPGSLPAEDYLAILAFALQANGVTLDAPLTLDSAATIKLNE